MYPAVARRLVSQANADLDEAAKRLVESAPDHNIDLSLSFATVEPGGNGRVNVRQCCLAVLGSGRTCMMFLSEPAGEGERADVAMIERVACVREARRHLERTASDRAAILQALPEPEEAWAVEAFGAAGFLSVGTLRYMRCDRAIRAGSAEAGAWPEGVSVERVMPQGQRGALPPAREAEVMAALERSYVDTLDCPELCGLRSTRDVLDSHRSTGDFDPSTWWLVKHRGRPAGCMLLNRCPEQRTIELVYLGLGPELRGKGLGRALLEMGVRGARRGAAGWAVTCAVDERNAPALRLYAGLGFEAQSRRLALVCPMACT